MRPLQLGRFSIGTFAVALLLTLVVACAGTSGTKKEATHGELRLAFRASFLHSCETGIPGPQGVKYCSCADDKLERAFSDAQLAKLTPENRRFKAIKRACVKAAGLRIRVGH